MAKVTKLTEEKGRVGGRLTARIKRKNKKFGKEIILKGGKSVKKISKKVKESGK